MNTLPWISMQTIFWSFLFGWMYGSCVDIVKLLPSRRLPMQGLRRCFRCHPPKESFWIQKILVRWMWVAFSAVHPSLRATDYINKYPIFWKHWSCFYEYPHGKFLWTLSGLRGKHFLRCVYRALESSAVYSITCVSLHIPKYSHHETIQPETNLKSNN